VCMSTHLGVQMARCDLVLNNTSWVPIGVPCAMGSGRWSGVAGAHADIGRSL